MDVALLDSLEEGLSRQSFSIAILPVFLLHTPLVLLLRQLTLDT